MVLARSTLALAAVLSACVPAPRIVCVLEGDRHLRMGEQALADGDLQRAKDMFSLHLEWDPSSAEAYLGLCKVQFQLGNCEKAERLCRKSISLGPTLEEPNRLLEEILHAGADVCRAERNQRSVASEAQQGVCVPDAGQSQLSSPGPDNYCTRFRALVREAATGRCREAVQQVAGTDVVNSLCHHFVWNRVDGCRWEPEARRIVADLTGVGVLPASVVLDINGDGRFLRASCVGLSLKVAALRDVGRATKADVERILGPPNERQASSSKPTRCHGREERWIYIEPCLQEAAPAPSDNLDSLGSNHSICFQEGRVSGIQAVGDPEPVIIY